MSNWKVTHLKPNTEKKFSQYCRLYDIPCYIPMRKTTRTYQRRKHDVELPVFPGYAFVCYGENKRLEILKSNLIVKVIEPFKPRLFLRELIMVRRALRVDPTLKSAPVLKEGQLVRIISGPFMGTEGVVQRVSRKMRVLLNISIIGQALQVETNQDTVELI
ncbi:MAG: KOW motif-containing protein [Kiritimatiellae bacterium]|nr:KOW motif-containing protein [Kiritimatiellia bacterium]